MLKIKNIVKSFPGAFEPVLNDVSLSLRHGDFCIIIGANGSGKSTLINIINGEYLPDSGTVEYQAKVAHVVQDVNQGTIPEMTLLENLALAEMQHSKPKLAFYKRYKEEIIKKIKSFDIDLEKYIHRSLNCLSGGQRQIIATLMAIHSGRQILLLDEHTSALDPKMQNLLMQYTAKQIEILRLTSIMITHRMDDAIKYGNRLVMLHKGKIVFDVEGTDKENLEVHDLLALFHQYEDQTLLSREIK